MNQILKNKITKKKSIEAFIGLDNHVQASFNELITYLIGVLI
jgi:hypothetical protein